MTKNRIIVLFGISGVGKTYLQHYLEKQYQIPMLITHTTRNPRPNEQNGIDYYFNTIKQFKHLDLMEFAKYNHNYYGSSFTDIQHLWNMGYQLVSATLDYHGVNAYIKRLGQAVIPLYLFASLNIVKNRLIKRGMPKLKIIQRIHEHQNDLSSINHIINNKSNHVIKINTCNWDNEKYKINKILD